MKYIMLLISGVFTCISCFAQITPMFEATIYVEDAVGNRDSVIIGYDTAATDGYDPAFGEEIITSSFDSIFEVSVGVNFFEYRTDMYKRIVLAAEAIWNHPDDCHVTGRYMIYIWAKHQPVTVSWDAWDFRSSVCNQGSYISNHWAEDVTDPYFFDEHPQNKTFCMAVRDSFTMHITEQAIRDSMVTRPVVIEKEVSGRGLTDIYGVTIRHLPLTNIAPCEGINVAAQEPQQSSGKIIIYPNPAQGQLFISSAAPVMDYTLHNSAGQSIKSGTAHRGYISVDELQTGLYFLKIKESSGGHSVHRFIKL